MVAKARVGFLSGLLASFATLRSLLEAGGSTSKTLNRVLEHSLDGALFGRTLVKAVTRERLPLRD
jgi:hypothetical protein